MDYHETAETVGNGKTINMISINATTGSGISSNSCSEEDEYFHSRRPSLDTRKSSRKQQHHSRNRMRSLTNADDDSSALSSSSYADIDPSDIPAASTLPISMNAGLNKSIGELADIRLSPAAVELPVYPLSAPVAADDAGSLFSYDELSDFMYSTDEADSLMRHLSREKLSRKHPASVTGEEDSVAPSPRIGGKTVVVLGQSDRPVIKLRKLSHGSHPPSPAVSDGERSQVEEDIGLSDRERIGKKWEESVWKFIVPFGAAFATSALVSIVVAVASSQFNIVIPSSSPSRSSSSSSSGGGNISQQFGGYYDHHAFMAGSEEYTVWPGA